MSFLSKLFGKKSEPAQSTQEQSDVEEFMSLIGIYNQAFIAQHVGITDIRKFPDLMMYKQVMRIPTVGGKIGVGERTYIRKWMCNKYGIEESFFKEIDSSIRRSCKNINDVQRYFVTFGTFTSDMLTFITEEYRWTLIGSIISKKILRSTVTDAVDKMVNKSNWKSAKAIIATNKVKDELAILRFSQEWMSELAYQVVVLSRRKGKKR